MGERVATSFRIDAQLLADMEAQCRRSGLSQAEAVELGMRLWLAGIHLPSCRATRPYAATTSGEAITQRDIEMAIELTGSAERAVRALSQRYLAGVAVEPGYYSMAHLMRLDRQVSIQVLRQEVRTVGLALLQELDRRLTVISQTGEWRGYWSAIREFGKANVAYFRLRLALWLLRLHAVDGVDLTETRLRLGRFLPTPGDV